MPRSDNRRERLAQGYGEGTSNSLEGNAHEGSERIMSNQICPWCYRIMECKYGEVEAAEWHDGNFCIHSTDLWVCYNNSCVENWSEEE